MKIENKQKANSQKTRKNKDIIVGNYILSKLGLKKVEDGAFVSFDDFYSLKESYPFAGIIDLEINRMNYVEYGDVSIAGLSELISKTDNPGLAFVASLSDKSYKQEEKIYEEELSENKTEELHDSETDKLFSSKNYNLEAIEDTHTLEDVKRRKYLLKKIKRVRKLYDLRKKWKAEAKIERVEKTEKIELNSSVASEKLAQIYLNQGLKDKAIEMYRQLILENPKKSNYFAQILEKIN